MKYRSNAYSTHRLLYHLVWIPKYRKRLLDDAIADRLKQLFAQCADLNDWEVHELNVQIDHVHMLVQIDPNIRLSKAVQYLNGGSSKIIRKEFPELEEFLWGDSFWATGYFAETVGNVNEDIIREYIRNQDQQR
jgi:putative transposase